MSTLLDAFMQILFRRRGPEDLPDSRFLLQLVLALYLMVQLPVAVMLYDWSRLALMAVLVDAVVLALCYYLLLRIAGCPERYPRTLTALLGTGVLFTIAQTPLVWLATFAEPAGGMPLPLSAALFALLCWSVVVQAHIASHALSRSFAVGLAIAITYFLVNFQIAGRLAAAGN